MLPFQFIDDSLKTICRGESGNFIGNRISFADSTFCWDDLKRFNVVLLGLSNSNNTSALLQVRKALYNLYLHNDKLNIIDLGNIPDNSTELNSTIQQIARVGSLALVLDPSSVATISIISDAANQSTDISITSIAPNIPTAILTAPLDNSHKLSRYAVLGFQTYLCNSMTLKLLAKHGYEAIRLGAVRANIAGVEPVLRDTHILTLTPSSVRSSDGGDSPNGLYAEELCQLSWYAGRAEFLNLAISYGFSDNDLTCQLVAQSLWHIIDGYTERESELLTGQNVKRFIVDRGGTGEELQFLQSSITNRWWMAIPTPENGKYIPVACTYEDYQKACAHEIPNRWLFFYQKFNI